MQRSLLRPLFLPLFAVAALSSTACSTVKQGPEPAVRPQEEVLGPLTAREAIVQLLEVGIGQARPDVVRQLVGPTYRQHNPRVPDGPEGVVGFVTRFAQLPAKKRIRVRVVRTLVDGEFVASQSEYIRGGRIISGFDVLRFKDGRFIEHWDGGMRQDGLSPSGHGLLDGSTAVDDDQPTATAKTTVERFVREILIAKTFAEMATFVSDECVQHHPKIGDGAASWAAWLGSNGPSRENGVFHTELVRTLGEKNFVMTQSHGRRTDGNAFVVYDLFRLDKEIIVEHWVSWERVPKRMAHQNGML